MTHDDSARVLLLGVLKQAIIDLSALLALFFREGDFFTFLAGLLITPPSPPAVAASSLPAGMAVASDDAFAIRATTPLATAPSFAATVSGADDSSADSSASSSVMLKDPRLSRAVLGLSETGCDATISRAESLVANLGAELSHGTGESHGEPTSGFMAVAGGSWGCS